MTSTSWKYNQEESKISSGDGIEKLNFEKKISEASTRKSEREGIDKELKEMTTDSSRGIKKELTSTKASIRARETAFSEGEPKDESGDDDYYGDSFFALYDEYPPNLKNSRGKSRSGEADASEDRKNERMKARKKPKSLLANSFAEGSSKASPLEEIEDDDEDDIEPSSNLENESDQKFIDGKNLGGKSSSSRTKTRTRTGSEDEKASTGDNDDDKSSPGGIWKLFSFPSWGSNSEEPMDQNERIWRTDPQTGPVDQEEAKRQSKYASQNKEGRIPKRYNDQIQPRKGPQPTPSPSSEVS